MAASGIACVDDDARARTKATLIILIILGSSIIIFLSLKGAVETVYLAIGLRGNNAMQKAISA
jgi:hypothetical protein